MAGKAARGGKVTAGLARKNAAGNGLSWRLDRHACCEYEYFWKKLA
jgi:hypothetical protein